MRNIKEKFVKQNKTKVDNYTQSIDKVIVHLIELKNYTQNSLVKGRKWNIEEEDFFYNIYSNHNIWMNEYINNCEKIAKAFAPIKDKRHLVDKEELPF